MTLHQLRLLRALAKHRNITQAGAEMLLSQPAVTLQLKELQKEFGTPVYERLGNTLHLTDAGYTLEHYAQRILALVDEAEEAVRTLQQGYGGRIRVGASNTPGIYLLPPLLSAFGRRCPAIELRIEVGNTKGIAEKIVRNELDLGIVGGSLPHKELMLTPWMTDVLILAVSASHPWAKRKTLAPEELLTEQLLGREAGSATRETYEQAFVKNGLVLPQTIEIGGGEAIKRAVESGLGVAILSAHSVAREREEGRIVALSLKGMAITRPLNIIYHKDKMLTAPMQELLHQLQESQDGQESPE
jgi:DNA-binding transcriptional LysR family regulator